MVKRLLAAVLAFVAMSVFAAVDVNKATSAELDGIKGIGPAIAGRITAERAKSPFKDWDDLIGRVSGIGEKTATKFSEGGLTVNGATYKGAAAAPAAAKPTAAKAATATAPAAAAAADAKSADKMTKKEKAEAKAEAKAQAKADAAADKAEAKAKKAKGADAAASAAKK
jgi:competence protein ComEA